MSVSLPVTEYGQVFVTTVTVVGTPVTLNNFSAALLRWSLSPNTAFNYPLELTVTITPGSEYVVLLTLDWDETSALANGAMDPALIPDTYLGGLFGTATTYELARETPTATTHTFSLDDSLVAQYMSMSQNYDHPWNGSLLLWLFTDGTGGSVFDATLSAHAMIDYDNRDTGSPGINSSRWSRCPVTGLKIPRGEMVIDGWRNVLVSPDAYDPPEPEPREWEDYEDPNEQGGG